jgi:hypothetical protein
MGFDTCPKVECLCFEKAVDSGLLTRILKPDLSWARILAIGEGVLSEENGLESMIPELDDSWRQYL